MKRVIIACIAVFLSAMQLEAQEKYSWDKDLHNRLLLDFNKSRQDIKAYVKKYIPDVTDKQLDIWEAIGALECMELDGKKRYFHNAAPNLFRLDRYCISVKDAKEGIGLSNSQKDCSYNIPQIISEVKSSADKSKYLGAKKHIKITFTVKVKPDAVPAGETVRCWLPFPRTDVARQTDVKLLSTSETKYKMAPTSCKHSSIYMEKKAVKGEPTIFQETFEYSISGEWHDLKPENIKPYDTSTALFREYTAEREKHIVFTPELKQLATQLTNGITNPYLKAKAIFTWIDRHVPWASSREYSTIDNIPMYVYKNLHGDCGQKSLLFITLCRICGIPAHFQSGLMMHPHADNLHDWSEIYFEGIGWVPVDMSFGIPSYARNEDEKFFFLGGIDSWRLIANNDFGMDFYPKKQYPRSETVDFQRGEVEWKGGNLYYDQWSYNWDATYGEGDVDY